MQGQGRTFQRGQVFWIAYCVDGKEYRESAGTDDPKKAERILKARLNERGAAIRGSEVFTTPAMKRVTIHELLENVKHEAGQTVSAQRLSTIKQADEAFGHFRAMALTSQHVKDYIDRMLAEHYAHASVNRITGIVRYGFTLAVREGTIPRAPYIKQLSEAGNTRTGFVTRAEFDRIKAHLPGVLSDFAEVGFACGWRRGEISKLEWRNVDADKFLRLRGDQTKNGNPRCAPISGKLVDAIKRRRAARGTSAIDNSDLVFHRGSYPVFEFRKAWASACRKAGKPGLLFHDLRRSFASASVQAGVPQLTTMAIGGWETASMFKRYAIIPEGEQVSAMERVEAWHAAQTANAPAQAGVRQMAASK
jgi:integrase